MKKVVAVLVVLVSAGLVLAGAGRSRGMGAKNVSVNAKGLADAGLSLIVPSDPAFEQEVAALLKDKRPALNYLVEAAKPFGVFVKNTGRQKAVGFNLRWELTGADGKVTTRGVSYANPGALVGVDESSNALLASAGYSLAPGQSRFMALDPSLSNLVQASLSTSVSASQQDIDEHIVRLRAEYAELTASASSVSVSIDGVFFEDGTFAGANASGFFEKVKGYVDARRDLARLVERDAANNAPREETFKRVEQAGRESKVPGGVRDESSTPSDDPRYAGVYAQSVKNFAEELLRAKANLGAEASVEHAKKHVGKAAPQLRRK